MLIQNLAPQFGRDNPDFYKAIADPGATHRPVDIAEMGRSFVMRQIPEYTDSIDNPAEAIRLGAGNCGARALLFHTFVSAFDNVYPMIPIITDGKRNNPHALNRLFASSDEALLIDNGYEKYDKHTAYIVNARRPDATYYIDGTGEMQVFESAEELDDEWQTDIHQAIAQNVRRMGVATPVGALDWDSTRMSFFVSEDWERLEREGPTSRQLEYLLLSRTAANLLIDAITETVQSPVHEQALEQFEVTMSNPSLYENVSALVSQ